MVLPIFGIEKNTASISADGMDSYDYCTTSIVFHLSTCVLSHEDFERPHQCKSVKTCDSTNLELNNEEIYKTVGLTQSHAMDFGKIRAIQYSQKSIKFSCIYMTLKAYSVVVENIADCKAFS